jgi:hypothetical protein
VGCCPAPHPPPCCGTLLECPWNREHTTTPHRPLSAHADAVCGLLAIWVIRAHTSHLAATRGTQYTPYCLI